MVMARDWFVREGAGSSEAEPAGAMTDGCRLFRLWCVRAVASVARCLATDKGKKASRS